MSRKKIDEHENLQAFLDQEKQACYGVFMVGCPRARHLIPESACAVCSYRTRLIDCPVYHRWFPEEHCEKCWRENPRDKNRCRYVKWKSGRIKEEKLRVKHACCYPSILSFHQAVFPVQSVIQHHAATLIVPAQAQEPPCFFPRLRMRPVTRVVELDGSWVGWVWRTIRRWVGRVVRFWRREGE